jgi:hypothetical protein
MKMWGYETMRIFSTGNPVIMCYCLPSLGKLAHPTGDACCHKRAAQ